MTAQLGVQDLRFGYSPDSEELFDGLSYGFHPGVVTALTGPSGRGKSTLLYILGLLLTPSSGRVLIGDDEVSAWSDSRRSRVRATQIGFIFQDSELDPARTVIDSVVEPAMYAGLDRRQALGRARELLDQFGLAARADHRPGEVSGGQAQRLAVCRALLNDPAVILADEPTGNLDRANADLVLDALTAAASQGRTVVVATHDPHVLTRCGEVVEL